MVIYVELLKSQGKIGILGRGRYSMGLQGNPIGFTLNAIIPFRSSVVASTLPSLAVLAQIAFPGDEVETTTWLIMRGSSMCAGASESGHVIC